ncbi:hypothetical protein ABVT39_002716 [Epinephelus coioides]
MEATCQRLEAGERVSFDHRTFFQFVLMDTLMTSHGIREETVLDFKSDTPKDPPSPKVEQEPEPPSGAKTESESEWESATADTPPRLSPCPSLERAPEADNDRESSFPHSWASCRSSVVEVDSVGFTCFTYLFQENFLGKLFDFVYSPRASTVKWQRPRYVILKKHEDLTKFSPDGIVALRHAVGHTIGYVDGGYHLLMTAVPKSRTGWAHGAGQVNKWNDRKPVKGGMFIQLEEQSGCILREEEKELSGAVGTGQWNPASPTYSRLDVKGQAVTMQACGSTSAGEAQVTIQL